MVVVFQQGTAAAAAAEPHAFAAPTIQAHDSFSKAVFATQGAPPGLFALRHNREFPLRRLTTIKEVSNSCSLVFLVRYAFDTLFVLNTVGTLFPPFLV